MAKNPPSDSNKSSGLSSFWAELKRRKVMRVAIAYAVVAWLIIQVAVSTFEGFGIPVWAFRFVVIMLVLFFPVAIILAWAFELTPEGIKTTKKARQEKVSTDAIAHSKKRNWMAYVMGAAVPTLIFGALAIFFYFQSPSHVTPEQSEGGSLQVEDLDKSIAVMPLINMSASEENAFFAGGVHEDILTNLSRIKDMEVVSRTTMLRYGASELDLKEIGEALKVQYIVEGSVRRIGNHVRVTIQLIDAANDRHIWANNFERELVDVFATQSELAREISNSIHLEIQPETVGRLDKMPTTSVRAYDLYIKAINIEKQEGETEASMLQIRDMLEQAVEEDPEFVEAWAVLKRAYDLIRNRVRLRSWYLEEGRDWNELNQELAEKARRTLAKAVALDSDNVETRLSMAVDHVWPQPEQVMKERKKILDQIIEEHPSHPKGWYHLAWWHRHDGPPNYEEGFKAFEEALKRDPFNARMVSAIREAYNVNGDETNVARLTERLTQIIPETAEDRHLLRIEPGSRLVGLETAFMSSGDRSFIDEHVRVWQEATASGEWDSPIEADWNEMFVSLLTQNQDRLVELERTELPDSKSSDDFAKDLTAFYNLHSSALRVRLQQGQTVEAERIARRLIDTSEMPELRQYIQSAHAREALTLANLVLGNQQKAKELAEVLVEQPGGPGDYYNVTGIRALSWIDTDRSADLALQKAKETPSWRGLDNLAAWHLLNPQFVIHPKIQSYYVKEGKWIEYLADHIPEYAAHKKK